MKIIDRTTGKRLVDDKKTMPVYLNKIDPVKRNAEKGIETKGTSPMDPPDAYKSDTSNTDTDINNFSPLLDQYVKEHKEIINVVNEFEMALLKMMQGKYHITKEINNSLNHFFVYFDEHIVPHNKHEERYLFPLLHQKLIEAGEHTPGNEQTTAVDLMEDDHVKLIQLASLTFNLLGLAVRLPDIQSRAITFDLAYHNGKELVELLKLHIFREDNKLFPLAQKLMPDDELKKVFSKQ